jgi:GAF domain/Pyridoxamine 5'-phosphate oxidase
MSFCLETMASCFQGIIPAMLFTCSKDGIPNAAFLSHVDYVDPTHVALSFQFFNKSRRNITENPRARVHVLDPDTSEGWSLRLRYVRSETSGPVFDRMHLRIEAIASYAGLKGIFKLKAADIYEVQAVERLPEEGGRNDIDGRRAEWVNPDAVFTMKALQDLSLRINNARNLEDLLDSILMGLEEFFGFRNSMILLTGEQPGTLVTIATRGYPEGGVGAEAHLGEGIIGMVAEAQKPIRISGLLRGMLHARAAYMRAEEEKISGPRPGVPMPGLKNPASQLGVPLLVRGELIGVLCIESETPYRFHEEDKTSIELLGSYLAIAIQNLQLQETAEGPSGDGPALLEEGLPPPDDGLPRRELVYYRNDECILIDGEYLIRSLPARILWKLLSERQAEGRVEFTNRELRLDKSLNLPDYKDNLETRLLLLRRRLDEKTPDIRLVPRARGRFALEVTSEVQLTERG